MGEYNLRCLAGGEILPPASRFELTCPAHAGLLRAEYAAGRLTVRPELSGLFRYIDWLPVAEPLPTKACPVTFQSPALSRLLGLPNLWLTFTGWSPAHGCRVQTGSFKELEAYPTLSRLREKAAVLGGTETIVVASAGNTGRAFAQAATETGMKCVLVVPEKNAASLWTTVPAGNNICLIAVSGDYTDAIRTADRICSINGFVSEGGAKNIARRDGMGTVLLDAVVTIGRLPDRYFQAVGSGTGGIAAWEASLRLIGDGRFGGRLPKLHLAQNRPFTPMTSAWRHCRRDILPEDMPDADVSIPAVYAPVLTNRSPPYGIIGGVYDAVTDCGGGFCSVSNSRAAEAAAVFEEIEEIDLDPAAAVAFAALMEAAEKGHIGRHETVVLNLTGGGYRAIRKDLGCFPVPVRKIVSVSAAAEDLKEILDGF